MKIKPYLFIYLFIYKTRAITCPLSVPVRTTQMTHGTTQMSHGVTNPFIGAFR